jgi:hypothetical protein
MMFDLGFPGISSHTEKHRKNAIPDENASEWIPCHMGITRGGQAIPLALEDETNLVRK